MANGNGSEPSVSGTESMEKAVASFLQALQANINNGTPEQRGGPVTIKQFQDLKPTTFTGGPDPMVTDAWVKDIEKIFRALPYTERQQEWWLLTLAKEEIMTWERFLEAFYEKYFPDSLREQKASEFIHLKQETMTVAEYESKFTQLARFATYVILTETRKTRKFEAGLDAGIKDRLEVLKLPTYIEVVDWAYIVEKGIKASRSGEPSYKKRFWERDNRRPDVAPHEKVNMGTTNSGHHGPTNPRCGTIPTCPTCGRVH
ncbi:uncharacterized protein LOC114272508 [Camellia sinensis]|uniref:uncharacterized protein LOC114272508 n=1 Tax=Camellia sinensis TaxID=4442 RepID=UPI001035D762|nr:uncharacterized protein LOC114272508 [Camellia sinensis]